METFAYLDPGTGSVIIQVVVGGVLAIAVVFRSFIGRIVTKIRSLFGREKTTLEDEQQ